MWRQTNGLYTCVVMKLGWWWPLATLECYTILRFSNDVSTKVIMYNTLFWCIFQVVLTFTTNEWLYGCQFQVAFKVQRWHTNVIGNLETRNHQMQCTMQRQRGNIRFHWKLTANVRLLRYYVGCQYPLWRKSYHIKKLGIAVVLK